MITKENERKFIELVTGNQQIIYKVCYFYTSDDFTLDELYQETVINLWKAFPGFRGECKVSTWIYRIAMNTCVSYMRKSSSRPDTIPITFNLADNLVDNDTQNIYLQEFYRMINKLGKLERALVLLYLEDKSHQEISEIMGISKNNVAVKLSRIKDKLKKMSNL